MTVTDTKEHAYELIDRLPPAQLTAVVGLLEAMLDPVSQALAKAPFDDEPLTDDESLALTHSAAWFKQRAGRGIPMEEVLADFDLTTQDFPLDQEKPRVKRSGPDASKD